MPLDPTLKLRPGRPSDVPALADIFLDAFSGNPIGQNFFPRDTPSARSFWTNTLTEEIHDPKVNFLVVTATKDHASPSSADQDEQPIIAFAKWVRPLPPGTPQAPWPADDEWPADGDPPRAAVFFRKLAGMHEEIMGARAHWYLEIIVTRAAHQGRGAGAMLMQWGAERADREGVECYLDATPAGKPLYERFGFRDAVETWPFFDEQYRHSFMVRKPKGWQEGVNESS
ncbi:acyl-CoA N-acyltransferase [Cryphonectria parasitica EP155]|uniref:Acyl-CoA N-acyltransferase n=1 Tax=Cryphonectria parasitica (strain ATCC 38755 / EP155) TaxID=660469 RepID=A0A9P4Y5L1_CRYP1|nr:acyl-CoA N-acyltransferase [Cryphonectria parasitica EP155]KAF3767143.1 acyl-CoA N-acyltransferase [Cryphonectria parasitica EP155]